MGLSLISLLGTSVNCLSWVDLLQFYMANQNLSSIPTHFKI